MIGQLKQEIIFRPASELPSADLKGRDVLVLNPCDGFHLGEVSVIEDDEGIDPPFIYIRDGYLNDLSPHTFYVAWALLPDSLSLSDAFIGEKLPPAP